MLESKEFGQYIKRKRIELGMTQAELGELICVSDKTISKWELGKCFPDITNLEILATSLHVSLAQLIMCEDNESAESEKDKYINRGIDYAQRSITKKLFRLLGIITLSISICILICLLFIILKPQYVSAIADVKVVDVCSDYIEVQTPPELGSRMGGITYYIDNKEKNETFSSKMNIGDVYKISFRHKKFETGGFITDIDFVENENIKRKEEN